MSESNEIKESINDNTERINELEKEVNFLLKEVQRLKNAKITLKLDVEEGE